MQQYLAQLSETSSLTEAIEEEVGGLSNDIAVYEKSANEKGFSGLSTWLRQYIASTGKPIYTNTPGPDGKLLPKQITLTINGVEQLITLEQAILPERVYYGLMRTIGNTPDGSF